MRNKRFLVGVWGCIGLVGLGLAAGENISWTWKSKPIVELKCDGASLQFGLRSDGVVVWREISHTTNSPAEKAPEIWFEWGGTNHIYLTNNLLYTPTYSR